MTLRATSTPLDRLSETELRNTVAEWSGIPYADLSTVSQTELNRMIDSTYEYISERSGHFPWAKREYTVALAADVQVLPMPADFRSMKIITETAAGKTSVAYITDKETWRRAWGTIGRVTHPWEDEAIVRWFFDGMDDSAAPLQQWKRHAAPTAAITMMFDYVPYFGTAASALPEIPAHGMGPITHHLRGLYAAWRRQYDVVKEEFSIREDLLAANQIADDQHGAADIDRIADAPPYFFRELSGP